MDETRVYAVASGKGGVGKTTTATALGACAVAAGRSAVVVDADLGMGNLATLLGVADGEGPTLHEVLAGDADVTEAVRAGPEGLDVVPSGQSLSGYAAADPAELGGAVETLRERYDVVVLDTGAGLSHDTVLPLGLADEAVLVTTPAAIAVANTEKTREMAGQVDTEVRGVVVTRTDAGDPPGVGEDLGVEVLGTVPEDEAVRRAAEAGVPVTAAAPESPAAGAYADVAAALLSVAVTSLSFGRTEETPDAAGGDAIPFATDGADATASEGGDAAAPTAAADSGEGGDSTAEEGHRSLLSRLSGGLLG